MVFVGRRSGDSEGGGEMKDGSSRARDPLKMMIIKWMGADDARARGRG